ncbi:SubName: Full=Related to carbonic anhydrase {ECO:0000313/EMBL:CCA67549.1} [Serendipita indica DSM 11827]|nr:SubName: Full=Related to carbonic anhydrase {ECO:0000313/EMBL:CCA67549.1} [Serendipita indica DSM 11827]
MVKSALVSTLLLAVSAFAHPHAHGGPSSDQLYSFLKARTSVSAAASEGAAANPSSGSSNGSAEGGRGSSTAFSAARFPDVQAVLEGNKRFVQNRDAKAIQELVDNGQKPPFMMVACSDSRAPEATIFDSKPGTFFMERNIANQYKPGDENAQSVMAYGIHVLGVQHIVILGHYGCGGIAASIATPPKNNINVASHIVNTWIGDIRQLYLTSNRSEIVEMRTANLAIEAAGGTVEEPKIREPGFRALVEENVKLQVQRLVDSSVMKNRVDEITTKLNTDGTLKASNSTPVERRAEEGGAIRPVFVHGWVHDLESGEIIDLNISSGPAGFENFVPPAAGEGNAESPSSSTTTAGGESATSTSAAEGGASSTSSAAEGAATTTSSAAEGGETSSTVAGEGAESSSSTSAEATAASSSSGDVRVHGPSSLGTRRARRSNARALNASSLNLHKRLASFGRSGRR